MNNEIQVINNHVICTYVRSTYNHLVRDKMEDGDDNEMEVKGEALRDKPDSGSAGSLRRVSCSNH